ncbi:hypothetical protein FRC11_005299, partial [Ceratobasidium sp. 423]
QNVISVGSVDNTALNVQNAIVSNGCKIPYLSMKNLEITAGLPIYSTSSDPTIPNDACDPLPNNTRDLSANLVLIRCGGCTFVTKTANAAAFLYTVSFPNLPATIPDPSGGLMSSFSSYGPTFDMYLKPALSAPGSNILSTYPVAVGSYQIKSGTSMATPFVAGSTALLLQIRGKDAEIAKAARAIFQNSAIPVRQTTANNSLLETASHQGAGLINAYDAVKNTGNLLPAELLLNDTAYFKGEHTSKLYNGGKKSVTYTLTHIPAGTANTIEGIDAIFGPVPLISNHATVKFEHSKVTVHPKSICEVRITIKPPQGPDESKFPVYSGYIKATGFDHTTLESTYMGLAAKLKDAHVVDNTDAYFGVKLPLITDKDLNPIPEGGSATYTTNRSDTPPATYRPVMGTPLLCIDLIDS